MENAKCTIGFAELCGVYPEHFDFRSIQAG
jgi:hypothetical protein